MYIHLYQLNNILKSDQYNQDVKNYRDKHFNSNFSSVFNKCAEVIYEEVVQEDGPTTAANIASSRLTELADLLTHMIDEYEKNLGTEDNSIELDSLAKNDEPTAVPSITDGNSLPGFRKAVEQLRSWVREDLYSLGNIEISDINKDTLDDIKLVFLGGEGVPGIFATIESELKHYQTMHPGEFIPEIAMVKLHFQWIKTSLENFSNQQWQLRSIADLFANLRSELVNFKKYFSVEVDNEKDYKAISSFVEQGPYNILKDQNNNVIIIEEKKENLQNSNQNNDTLKNYYLAKIYLLSQVKSTCLTSEPKIKQRLVSLLAAAFHHDSENPQLGKIVPYFSKNNYFGLGSNELIAELQKIIKEYSQLSPKNMDMSKINIVQLKATLRERVEKSKIPFGLSSIEIKSIQNQINAADNTIEALAQVFVNLKNTPSSNKNFPLFCDLYIGLLNHNIGKLLPPPKAAKNNTLFHSRSDGNAPKHFNKNNNNAQSRSAGNIISIEEKPKLDQEPSYSSKGSNIFSSLEIIENYEGIQKKI